MYLNAPSCGLSNVQYLLPKDVGSIDITPLCQSAQSTCNGGTNLGYQKFTYRTTIQLTSPCSDYNFSVCHYARNGNINTVSNPDYENLCVESNLNKSLGNNSSPLFSFDPISFLCMNQTTCVNSGATDIDGDSISYELINPLTSNSANTIVTWPSGVPNVGPYYMGCPPPMSNIQYLTGWNYLNPVTGTTSFNQNNGDLCLTPTQPEISVVAVRVKEYRNGVLIGTVIRDMQVMVLANCSNSNPDLGDISGGTSTKSDTTVCPDVPLLLSINVTDPDGNNVNVSYSNSIPGATVSVTGNNTTNAVLTFAWTPTQSQVSPSPFCFTVNPIDDHCPYFGNSSRTYCIYVQNPSVNVSTAGPFCGSVAPFNMTGNPNSNGTWTWSGTGITNSNLGTFDPSVAGQGAHWVKYEFTDNVGCKGEDSTLVNINGSPVADGGPDTSICASGTVNLQLGGSPTGSWGTGPYSFSWSPANYLWNATIPNPSLTSNIDTTFQVVVTDALGCTDTAFVDVAYFGQPSADAGANLSVCSNGFNSDTLGGLPTAVGGTGPYEYLWSPSTWVSADSIANPIIIAGNTGTVTVIVTDSNGCTDTDSVTVSYSPSPSADAGPDIASCGQNLDTIGGVPTAFGGTAPYTYQWFPYEGLDDSSLANPHLNFDQDTIYIVEVTDANGCTALDTVFAEFIGINADFDMTPVSNFAPTDVAFDNNSDGATEYDWDFGDGGTSDNTSPNHYYNGSGSYVVQLIAYNDKTGCLDTATKILVLDGASQIYVPNVITPNGDGENDQFMIMAKNIEKFKCVIYNRWGTELYKFDEVQNNWDGYTYAGKKVPNGTYFYLITAKGADESEYNFKGTFSILGAVN
jgi:gliding motility-associated-like protein